jgi:hypothetical protein
LPSIRPDRDPQVIRVGIHGADRTVDLLFAGRKGERIAQRFRHFGVAVNARQAADIAEQRPAVLQTGVVVRLFILWTISLVCSIIGS